MALNAPNMVIYVLTLLVALVGLLAYFGVLGGFASFAFWLMAVAFAILAVGVLLKTA